MCESCWLQFSLRRMCDLEDMLLSETEFTKRQNLASEFSKDSTRWLAYGFLSKSLRFCIAFHKRWTKVIMKK
jgi:hypothetical protein